MSDPLLHVVCTWVGSPLRLCKAGGEASWSLLRSYINSDKLMACCWWERICEGIQNKKQRLTPYFWKCYFHLDDDDLCRHAHGPNWKSQGLRPGCCGVVGGKLEIVIWASTTWTKMLKGVMIFTFAATKWSMFCRNLVVSWLMTNDSCFWYHFRGFCGLAVGSYCTKLTLGGLGSTRQVGRSHFYKIQPIRHKGLILQRLPLPVGLNCPGQIVQDKQSFMNPFSTSRSRQYRVSQAARLRVLDVLFIEWQTLSD
jgi:hypothetical protein